MVASNASSNATALPTYNECRYALFDAETKCRSDRNCADCLKKKGCRIGTGGFCEPDTSLNDPEDDALNYKRAVVTNVSQPNNSSTGTPQKWLFPASEVTYCGGDDAVCNRCAGENYGAVSDAEDSRFCMGAGGCVCVQNCKNSFMEEMYCDVDDTAASHSAAGGEGSIDGGAVARLPADEVTGGSGKSHQTSAGVWVAVAAAVVVVALALGFAFKRMRAHRTRRFEGVPQELEEESAKTSTARRGV